MKKSSQTIFRRVCQYGDERKISTESNSPEWVREMFQKQQCQIEEILQFMLESNVSSVTCTIQQIKKRQRKQYRR